MGAKHRFSTVVWAVFLGLAVCVHLKGPAQATPTATPTDTPTPTPTATPYPIPDFGADSAVIDNQYLRLDLMDPAQEYTGWGPNFAGAIITWTDLGTETVTTPPSHGAVAVNCRVIQVPYGPDWDDVYTFYLAQDDQDIVPEMSTGNAPRD